MRFQILKASAKLNEILISYLQINKILIQTHCLTGTVLFLQTTEQIIKLVVSCIGRHRSIIMSQHMRRREEKKDSLEINTKL